MGSASASIYIDRRALYQLFTPTIHIVQHKDPSQQRTDIQLLQTELHELCHMHQSWYTFKEHIDYNYLRDNMGIDEQKWGLDLWIQTPMAQEFNNIVGFSQREDGTWKIRSDNPYRGVYGSGSYYQYFASDPQELSAGLCAFYLLQEIQPDARHKRNAQPPYITEELKGWIETYIVLPEQEMTTDQG